MKDYDYIKDYIRLNLSPVRYEHTLSVQREAEKLAVTYNQDLEKCRLAALIHDMAKEYSDKMILSECERFCIKVDDIQSKTPQLLHGPLAARIARELFEIQDVEILNSVEYHTTGRVDMSLVEKIVYLADLIEEDRDFPGTEEIRSQAYTNINKALLMSCNSTLEYIIRRNLLIHPLTIEFRNDLILKGGA